MMVSRTRGKAVWLMAERFSVDLEPAAQLSRDLSQIRADLMSGGQFTVGADVTGSPQVVEALREFFADSSDNRHRMEDLLERAAGLLRGLIDGVQALDASLAGSLQPHGNEPVGRLQ